MNTSIIIWNVNGLGDPWKRGRVKRLIGRQNPKIVGLIETKWDHCSDSLVCSVSGSRDYGWVAKGAVRSSGGIVVFWNKSFFRMVSTREGYFFLEIEFRDVVSLKAWHLIVVYGPQDRSDKLVFISELNELCSLLTSPVCLAGDFNLVRSHDDYLGSRRSAKLMEEFNSFIDVNALLELPLGGSSFTWHHRPGSNSFSRIDRVLVLPEFDSFYQDVALSALERVESDHNPLLIRWGGEQKDP
ncbi:unnamed protein product [Linum trigynum]|uniref:Endonuclease/exonuclease/phosphatase domain-containing protein n=1 Tax=Linum trigynum TaxID=586398 RepID=A0AAV2E2U1_9ROSI